MTCWAIRSKKCPEQVLAYLEAASPMEALELLAKNLFGLDVQRTREAYGALTGNDDIEVTPAPFSEAESIEQATDRAMTVVRKKYRTAR